MQSSKFNDYARIDFIFGDEEIIEVYILKVESSGDVNIYDMGKVQFVSLNAPWSKLDYYKQRRSLKTFFKVPRKIK